MLVICIFLSPLLSCPVLPSSLLCSFLTSAPFASCAPTTCSPLDGVTIATTEEEAKQESKSSGSAGPMDIDGTMDQSTSFTSTSSPMAVQSYTHASSVMWIPTKLLRLSSLPFFHPFLWSVQSNPTLSCTDLACPALPCPALPCPALSCTVLSCPVMYCTAYYQSDTEPFPCYSYDVYFLVASFSLNFTYPTPCFNSLPLPHHFSLPILPTLNQSGQCDDLLAALPAHASLQDAGFSMTPLAFEKDDDSHMRVIAAVGNLRARWVFHTRRCPLLQNFSLFYLTLLISHSISIQNVVDIFSSSSIPSFLCSLFCPHQTSSLSINFHSYLHTYFTPSLLLPSLTSFLFPLLSFLSYHVVEITRYLKLICTLLGASRARSHPPLLPPLLSSQVSKGNNHL